MSEINENLQVIGKSVIARLENGVNVTDTDPLVRVTTLDIALRIAFLRAATNLNVKNWVPTQEYISLLDKKARGLTNLAAKTERDLSNPAFEFSSSLVLKMLERVDSLNANARYIRAIEDFATSQDMVDFIHSQSDLAPLAEELARNAKRLHAEGKRGIGHSIFSGVASIQF